jgi:hypothetical protein
MWPIIDQLVQQGVTDFFIAPGSRNTPLVIAASRHPKVLAFMRLGVLLEKKSQPQSSPPRAQRSEISFHQSWKRTTHQLPSSF